LLDKIFQVKNMVTRHQFLERIHARVLSEASTTQGFPRLSHQQQRGAHLESPYFKPNPTDVSNLSTRRRHQICLKLASPPKSASARAHNDYSDSNSSFQGPSVEKYPTDAVSSRLSPWSRTYLKHTNC
jgi:hypothetical protein